MWKRKPIRFFILLFGVPALLGTLALGTLASWPWVLAWLACINLSATVMWSYDKWQARRRAWRVPETALHAFALAGATPASLLAMKVLRHKTLKMHFVVLYTIVFLLQLALAFTLAGRSQAP